MSIHEAGTDLEGLVAGEGQQIFDHLQAAAERALALQAGVEAVTGASSHPAAEALRARIAGIIQSIGTLTVDVAGLEEDKNSLLEAWGIVPSDTGLGSPVSATPRTHTESTPFPAAILSRKLPPELPSLGPVRIGKLQHNGIHTILDAFVAGEMYISDIKTIGGTTVDQIRAYITRVAPGIPFKERPTPMDIAVICPTLQQVSWAAANDMPITFYQARDLNLREQRLSVHDLLHMSPEEIIGRPLSGLDKETQAIYQRLVRNARAFAPEFEAAQQVLRHTKPNSG